jgi:hypothetical protein
VALSGAGLTGHLVYGAHLTSIRNISGQDEA